MSARTPRGLARVATLGIAAVLAAGLPGTASAAPAAGSPAAPGAPPPPPANPHEDTAPVDFHSWDSLPDFLHGRLDGLLPTPGGLRFGRPGGALEPTRDAG